MKIPSAAFVAAVIFAVAIGISIADLFYVGVRRAQSELMASAVLFFYALICCFVCAMNRIAAKPQPKPGAQAK